MSEEADLVNIVQECVKGLDHDEAEFLQECHLAEPRSTLNAFAKLHGLTASKLNELRCRAMTHLKEVLADKGVMSVGDVI